MKDINNFITESFEINKNTNVQKNKNTHVQKFNNLCMEVQNDINKKYEYHTYSIDNGIDNFNKGFVYVSPNDFIGIQAFNNVEEFEKGVGTDIGSYSDIDKLNVGESTKIYDSIVIRIW